MGAAASVGVSEKVQRASIAELEDAFSVLSSCDKAKVVGALSSEVEEATSVERPNEITKKISEGEITSTVTGAGTIDSGEDGKFEGEYQSVRGTPFADVLSHECIAVVKAAYFEDCFRDRRRFEDRANIPSQYFFTGSEAVKLWSQYRFAFLIVLSYGWLSKTHPDPHLFHLKRIARILTEFKAFTKKEWYSFDAGRPPEVGVILDFCSLWQRQGDVDTRTEQQRQQFEEGLSSINTPYGHQDVTAVKLMDTAGDLRGYDDRGWTLFESVVINGKGASGSGGQLGKLNALVFDDKFDPATDPRADTKFIEHYGKSYRWPPLHPDRFKEELEKRRLRAHNKGVNLFTNGKDQAFILDKYVDAYRDVCCAKALDYSFMKLGNRGVQELARVLPDMHALQKLSLEGDGISDLPANMFANLTSLKHLSLRDNRLDSLHPMMFGNLVNLDYLDLEKNLLSDPKWLSSAIKKLLPSCSIVRVDRARRG